MNVRRTLGALVATAAVGLVIPAATASGDPEAGRQWGMALVGAPKAWQTSTGRGVTVAVVDTGIDLHHQDLPASRLVIVPGANLISPGELPQDDHGHGTHVAGIVGAESGNGLGVESVAPGAKLMPVKVLTSGGSSKGNSVEDGIMFAADHGAKVINISIGVQLVQPVTGPGFESAIEYAWSKGAVCVVAAGNNYNGGVLGSGYSSDTHAIVVAATDRNDSPATYSSGSNGARWGMAAPGGADPNTNSDADLVFSTFWFANRPNSYGYDAGTSMAAPHVAGAVADLLALGLTPQQAVDRVLTTAKKGLSASLGAGRLDVAAAVAGLGPSATPTTLRSGSGSGSGGGSTGSGGPPSGGGSSSSGSSSPSSSSGSTRSTAGGASPSLGDDSFASDLLPPTGNDPPPAPAAQRSARALRARPVSHTVAWPLTLAAVLALLGPVAFVGRRLVTRRSGLV